MIENGDGLKIFKPVFIDFNLPYNWIQGEKFVVVATVFNYFDTPIDNLEFSIFVDERFLILKDIENFSEVAVDTTGLKLDLIRTANHLTLEYNLTNNPVDTILWNYTNVMLAESPSDLDVTLKEYKTSKLKIEAKGFWKFRIPLMGL